MTSETTKECNRKRRLKVHLFLKCYGRLLSCSATVLMCMLVSLLGWMAPVHTYIRCHDASINKSLLKNTISVRVLLSVTIISPFLIMTIVEWLVYFDKKSPFGFISGARRSFSLAVDFIVGLLFSFFLVEILKTSVGGPRPHFLNSCDPVLPENCDAETWVFITHEDCQNPHNLTQRALLDTMKSFPSGHASLGVFGAVFMIIYLQCRLRVSWSLVLVPFLQLLLAIWGSICCVSRIWDNKHHWLDVFVGAIIGAAAGYFTVVYMCDWFQKPSDKNYYGIPKLPPKLSEERSNGHLESNSQS